MEFETNYYDTEISLYFSRFSSLPQAVSARFFFFSKDDERLKGIMGFIHIHPYNFSTETLQEKKCCLVINVS